MPIHRQHKLVSDVELAALLAKFEAETTVDANKTIHFHRFEPDALDRILPDAFQAHPDLTARQLRYILREALWQCRKTGPLTVNGLIAVTQRLAKAQLAQRPQLYSLWTKFRARQMAFCKGFALQWGDVSLQSASNLPDYMVKEEYFFSGHGRINPDEPVFYGYLIARCEARTEENAVARMLDAIALFMGIFNMYELWGRWSIGAERWAEGKLWNGPYQFVFRGETFLGDDQIWFDPNFSEEAWGQFPPEMEAVLRLIPRVHDALTALADHPLSELLTNVLRLMQNAMSSRDQSYSLLRYWSALEQVYGNPNSRTKNYDQIIKRATFAEKDKLIARWKLNHISRLRNHYVHAGDYDDDLRVMSQYLRLLLSRHINYLLFHAKDVARHEQWLEFVDLPDDESLLKTRKAAIDRRIALIQRESHDGQQS